MWRQAFSHPAGGSARWYKLLWKNSLRVFTKVEDIQPRTVTQNDLQESHKITCSVRSQAQNNTCHVIPFIWNTRTVKTDQCCWNSFEFSLGEVTACRGPWGRVSGLLGKCCILIWVLVTRVWSFCEHSACCGDFRYISFCVWVFFFDKKFFQKITKGKT